MNAILPHLNPDNVSKVKSESYSEQELVSLAQASLPYDTQFYSRLVKPYVPLLRGYCAHLLKDDADAEDATQEVLIKSLSALKGFRWTVSFRSWIYSIAHNECIDRIRVRKRFQKQTEAESIECNLVEQRNEFSTSFEEVFQSILPLLSFDEKDLLLLRHSVGMSFNEVAETLDEKLSTVKMRHKRLIEKIRTNVNRNDNSA